MRQRALPCKAQNAQRQRNAGKQVQPFGYHAHQRGHRAGDGIAESGAVQRKLAHQHGCAQRHNKKAHQLQPAVQRRHNGRALLFIALCLLRKAGGPAVFAHGGKPCAALPRRKKAAGKQPVPRALAHVVCLAC